MIATFAVDGATDAGAVVAGACGLPPAAVGAAETPALGEAAPPEEHAVTKNIAANTNLGKRLLLTTVILLYVPTGLVAAD